MAISRFGPMPTEAVSPVDDNGVGGRDVEAALYDGGADQQVESTVIEIEHDPFQIPLAHLTMGHADPGLRDEFLYPACRLIDGLDTVVQHVDLAAPADFAEAGLTNLVVPPLGHERLHGKPFRRGCRDQGQIPQSSHRHVERPRDRCCGKRQHVHLGPELLQPLLVPHAEPVLLVDHDQTQIGEGDIPLKQAMGADDNIHLTLRQPAQDALGLFPRPEP